MLDQGFDFFRHVVKLGCDAVLGSSASTYEYTILIEKPRDQVWQALWSRAQMQGDIPVTYDIRQMPNDPALFRMSVQLDAHKREGYLRVHECREGHAVIAERFYDADEEGEVLFHQHHIGHVLTEVKGGQATLLTQYDHVTCDSFSEKLSYLVEARVFLSEFKRYVETPKATEPAIASLPAIDERDAFWSVAAAATAFFGGWYFYDLSWAMLIFMAFSIHEFGHVVAMNYLGLPTSNFFMFPFIGGHAVRKSKFRTQFEGAFCSLMGPVISLLPCLCFFILYCLTGHLFFGAAATLFALVNLLNLVPLWPFDGAQVIKSLIASARQEDVLALAWTVLIMGLVVALYHGLIIFAIIAGFAAYHLVAPFEDHHKLGGHFLFASKQEQDPENHDSETDICVLPKMSDTATAVIATGFCLTLALYAAVLLVTLRDHAISGFLGM